MTMPAHTHHLALTTTACYRHRGLTIVSSADPYTSVTPDLVATLVTMATTAALPSSRHLAQRRAQETGCLTTFLCLTTINVSQMPQ